MVFAGRAAQVNRIMIFGRGGSGKSTFAHALSKRLGLPLYHLDKHFYTDHWVERSEAAFMSFQKGLVQQDSWIIEGNCIRSLETRYKRADLVLYFNFPKLLCLWRIIRRAYGGRNHALDDRAPNCPEGLTWKLLRYSWHFEKRVDQKIADLRTRYPETPFYEVQDLQSAWKCIRA